MDVIAEIVQPDIIGEIVQPQIVMDVHGDQFNIVVNQSTFVHDQGSAQTEWVIDHNLHTFPSVTVVDSAGTVVIGEILYNSDIRITLTFSAAFSGKAYLN